MGIDGFAGDLLRVNSDPLLRWKSLASVGTVASDSLDQAQISQYLTTLALFLPYGKIGALTQLAVTGAGNAEAVVVPFAKNTADAAVEPADANFACVCNAVVWIVAAVQVVGFAEQSAAACADPVPVVVGAR